MWKYKRESWCTKISIFISLRTILHILFETELIYAKGKGANSFYHWEDASGYYLFILRYEKFLLLIVKIVDRGKNLEEDTFERGWPFKWFHPKRKVEFFGIEYQSWKNPVSLSTISNTPLTHRGSPLLFETLFPPPTQLNRNSKFEPSVTGQTDKYDKSGGNRTKRRNKRELRRDGPRRGRVHISLSPRGWRGKVKVKGKRSCPGG